MSDEALSEGTLRHVDRSENVSGFSEISFSSTLTADSDHLASAPLVANGAGPSGSIANKHPLGKASAAVSGQSKAATSDRGWKAIPETSSSKEAVVDDPLTPRANGQARLLANGDHAGPSGGTGLHSPTLSPPTHRYGSGSDAKRQSVAPQADLARTGFYDPDSVESLASPADDDAEARRVQQNLERWAAEERNRRKAARTSRTSLVAPPTSGSSLARRLSGIRASSRTSNAGLGAGPSSEALADATSPSTVYSPTTPRGLGPYSASGAFSRIASRPNSLSSLESSNTQDDLIRSVYSSDSAGLARTVGGSGSVRISSFGSLRPSDSTTLEDVPESEDESVQKGKGRARNPFDDPAEDNIYRPATGSSKPQPTAARPIVTVGRASSIQRRTIEAGMMGRGKGKRRMPSIVATDTEPSLSEADESASRRQEVANPFASAEDGSYPPTSSASDRLGGVSTTLHQGGLDEEVAMELAGKRAVYAMSGSEPYSANEDLGGDVGAGSMDSKLTNQPLRASTSSSKFRELGITAGGDDWMDAVEASDRRTREARSRQQERTDSRSWWTDWLCGCRRADDEEEQAGRTNPME